MTVSHHIKVRRYAEKAGDYQIVSSWLERRGLPRLMETILPQCGIIVELDGAPASACWMYCDTSIGVAWFHGLVTDPGLGFARARAIIQVTQEALIRCARASGYSVVMAHAAPALARKYIEYGWTQVGSAQLPFMRRID